MERNTLSTGSVNRHSLADSSSRSLLKYKLHEARSVPDITSPRLPNKVAFFKMFILWWLQFPTFPHSTKCKLPHPHCWLSKESLEVPFHDISTSSAYFELLPLRTLQLILNSLFCGPYSIPIRDTDLNLTLTLISPQSMSVEPDVTEWLRKIRNCLTLLFQVIVPGNHKLNPTPGDFLIPTAQPPFKISSLHVEVWQTNTIL